MRREQRPDAQTFRERQVNNVAEKVRESNGLITRVLRQKTRGFLVNAGRALDAAQVIANEAPPPSASTAFREAGAGGSNPLTPIST